MDRTIAIAGAGIAGLACALFMARKGFHVTIVERAAELKEVGAGLQLTPNATRLLHRLGLEEALRAVAVAPVSIDVMSGWSGDTLSSLDLGNAIERYGAPYYAIHRADLQNLLADAARANPLIALRTGCTVSGLDEDHEAILLDDGERIEADILIGADGVRSKIRPYIRKESAPTYTGYTALRATIPAPRSYGLVSDRIQLRLGNGFHVVAYPVRSGDEINIVMNVQLGKTVGVGSEFADAAHYVAHWPEDIRAAVDSAGRWLAWPLNGVSPEGKWTDGKRTALIGDAAHAMLPFMAQGAASGIEDGAYLAGELAALSRHETSIALHRYEVVRRARVSRIWDLAAKNGKTYHMGGVKAVVRNLVIRMMGQKDILSRFDWIYSYDAEK